MMVNPVTCYWVAWVIGSTKLNVELPVLSDKVKGQRIKVKGQRIKEKHVTGCELRVASYELFGFIGLLGFIGFIG